MSEVVPSIICKIYRNIRFFQDIEIWIIDPWCLVDISFEYDSYIDSSLMCLENSSDRRFLCPGIYFEPDTIFCIFYICVYPIECPDIRKCEEVCIPKGSGRSREEKFSRLTCMVIEIL